MRIVAGKFRGIQLNTFEADNIRPTTDRVRENIFNKIQFNILDARVLDLFGGTGAISLEFISRGAREVITCDNNRASISLIKGNFAKCKIIPNLIEKDYLMALDTLKDRTFDIIFLDPPFKEDYGSKALNAIDKYGLLEKNGTLIYEHIIGKDYEMPQNFEVYDEKKYGTIVVDYIRRVCND